MYLFLCDSIQICGYGYCPLRVYRIQRNAFAQRSHAYEERAARRLASVSATTGPLSFLNLPVQLNFTLWYSTIGHCARLVTQIILSLSKYGPRIVSTAQPGTKYPYLPPAVSNREESTLSKLDPLYSKILRFTYSRNDLSPLLRTALVIASGVPPSLFVVRGHVCSYALRSNLLTFKMLFFPLSSYSVPRACHSEGKFERKFICKRKICLSIFIRRIYEINLHSLI